MKQQANKILENAFGKEIAKNLIDSFVEIQENFFIKKWKIAELDAGHFVESVRRAIELELFKSFTPFGKKLPDFNDATIKSYELASGDETYRILIPRVLKSIYNIRNKRGVGHVGLVSPNEMDATLILYSIKWVLAELIRLKSKLSIKDTQTIVSEIVERQIELVWEPKNGLKRILNTNISASNKILIHLFEENFLSENELIKRIEYKNPTDFRKILKRLHTLRLIEYSSTSCEITPKGIILAEKEILSKKMF